MQWSIDLAFKALKNNEQSIKGAAESNEDTTRMRAIDTILFEVLKWDKLAVETEKYCRSEGYADYVFHQTSSSCLVLEAKKSGATFVLKHRKYNEHPFLFGLLETESKDAALAVRQALGYATELGSRYIAISNGTQWLLGMTFTNQPVSERPFYVFESYDAIQSRFALFWKCFSTEGLYNNEPSVSLIESRQAPAPSKLSMSIQGYPMAADRNVIANELGYVLDLVWERMSSEESEENFLRECYCHPDSFDDVLALSKELLDLRHEMDQTAAQHNPMGKLPPLVTNYQPEKPVILLGRIGHGKTSFIRYLRLVEAKDKLRNYIQLDINFIDRPSSRADVSAFIYSEIDRQLREHYDVDIESNSFVRAALNGELRRFRTGPAGVFYEKNKDLFLEKELECINKLKLDQHAYLRHCLQHLKGGRNKSIAIFLDNLDRREDDIQEEAFLRASAMARDWAALVFVALRPGTFYESRSHGVLDSMAPKVFSVAPPRVSVMLGKRFGYAKKIAGGETGLAFGPEASVHLPKVAMFLECCEATAYERKDLITMLDAVANGDLRSLLGYTKSILTSQHLNTKKILGKIHQGYRMPVHEGLRALLYGDHIHYDPTRSVFLNLFDIQHADPREHFARLLALEFLARLDTGSTTRGFIRQSELMSYLTQLGFGAGYVTDTIRFLHDKKCIEFNVPVKLWSDSLDKIRITSLGKYHVTSLVRGFQYLDAVVIDTPITNATFRSQICDAKNIRERLDRCELFLHYLNECVQSIQDGNALQLWSAISDAIHQDVEVIKERSDR